MPEMGTTAPTPTSRPARLKAAAEGNGLPISLADALFTPPSSAFCRCCSANHRAVSFASELIKLTGSGSGAVQRELKRLASSGLVTVIRIGKQKHYQANPDSPVFGELCGLVLKTVAMAQPIRRALEPFTDRIVLALVYGSVAKGTDTATSDIDLLVGRGSGHVRRHLLGACTGGGRPGPQDQSALYTPRDFADRKAAGNAFPDPRAWRANTLVLIGGEDEPSVPR